MLKQRFATMMHVFASVNFNDTIGKIKHIKSENKAKILAKDRKSTGANCRHSGTDNTAETPNGIENGIIATDKKQTELPIVRIKTFPTAKYSPKTLPKRSSIS